LPLAAAVAVTVAVSRDALVVVTTKLRVCSVRGDMTALLLRLLGHVLPSGLRLIVTTSATQLDPVHEADARFFERDRDCWKAGLRSAGFTNACGRRSSPPLRKLIESPAHGGGRAVPDWISVSLRHISIMRLLSLGHEKREAGLRCLAWSPEAGLTWVNVMRLVSDEASRLSAHTRFRKSRAQIRAHASHRARFYRPPRLRSVFGL
jgi:hypothetical protein